MGGQGTKDCWIEPANMEEDMNVAVMGNVQLFCDTVDVVVPQYLAQSLQQLAKLLTSFMASQTQSPSL